MKIFALLVLGFGLSSTHAGLVRGERDSSPGKPRRKLGMMMMGDGISKETQKAVDAIAKLTVCSLSDDPNNFDVALPADPNKPLLTMGDRVILDRITYYEDCETRIGHANGVCTVVSLRGGIPLLECLQTIEFDGFDGSVTYGGFTYPGAIQQETAEFSLLGSAGDFAGKEGYFKVTPVVEGGVRKLFTTFIED